MLVLSLALAFVFPIRFAGEKVIRGRGFLSLDRELKLLNEFHDGDSISKMSYSSYKRRDTNALVSAEISHTISGQQQFPTEQKEPPLAEWKAIKRTSGMDTSKIVAPTSIDRVWIPKPPTPGQPLVVNYSIGVLDDPMPPCKEKLQRCQHRTQSCEHILRNLKQKLIDANSELHHMTNDHPLLNTLAIRSEVHRRKSPLRADSAASHRINPKSKMPLPSPLPTGLRQAIEKTFSQKKDEEMKASTSIPPQSAEMNVPGGLTPEWAAVNITNVQMDNVGKGNLTDTSGIAWVSRLRSAAAELERVQAMKRQLKNGTRKGPLRQKLGIGPLRQELFGADRFGADLVSQYVPAQANDAIAARIAEHIATHVSSSAVHELVDDNFNKTCTFRQARELEDCLDFVQVCTEQMQEKEDLLRGIKQEIKMHMSEFEQY